jgi:hypothetical protein
MVKELGEDEGNTVGNNDGIRGNPKMTLNNTEGHSGQRSRLDDDEKGIGITDPLGDP